MARPRKHDGAVYRRRGTQFWWMRHSDRAGIRREEPTGTSDWKKAQKKLRERLRTTHYVSWSEQQRIEAAAPSYVRNVVRIITETGLRIYKELTPMKKDQVDSENKVVWIPESKTPNGVAEVPLTDLAVEALRDQMQFSGNSAYLFPSDENATGHQTTFKTAWRFKPPAAEGTYFPVLHLPPT